MLNIDRVWSRVSQLPQYRGKKLSDFILQDVTYSTQLTTGQALANQPVIFPAGAILVGGRAGAAIPGVAATQTGRDGLDMFTVAIADQQTQRNIVGTTQMLASAVFGRFNDQFPAKEIIVPVNGGLLYSFTNLTTTTINIYFTHDCLVPAAQG